MAQCATGLEAVQKIADAVLYEGFLLYPYRKTSLKNQQRWQFGTLGAPGGADRTCMQTQCLVEGGWQTSVDVRVRFLQDETERQISIAQFPLGATPEVRRFQFPPIEGEVELRSEAVLPNLHRLTCRVMNLSTQSCLMSSTHTILALREGAFVSLMDPPEEYKQAAASCRNQGTWPVLAGTEGERRLMLSSPIILYDYPKIAPESRGSFFDATEIDEMLTLRVMTLSDQEKEEVRAAGESGREVLERTETLPQEAFAKMHGAIRGLRRAQEDAALPEFQRGDRVLLHPARRADIFDIALDGRIGIVESVERDFENNTHLAVTLEDDPGRDLGAAAQIGHRFFFRPEEVERL
ncbi:MAG TPA: hypothetical protein VHC90_07830 [Bryobacteraceae bacterium]|nr:hypothetical protein [Bryobacteraceae bacterium]